MGVREDKSEYIGGNDKNDRKVTSSNIDIMEKEEQHKTHIAYCIPSLDHSGGMERVLTIKANYLADQLDYDVSIIITDDKDSAPYFPLSDKIRIQLDINIDNL